MNGRAFVSGRAIDFAITGEPHFSCTYHVLLALVCFVPRPLPEYSAYHLSAIAFSTVCPIEPSCSSHSSFSLDIKKKDEGKNIKRTKMPNTCSAAHRIFCESSVGEFRWITLKKNNTIHCLETGTECGQRICFRGLCSSLSSCCVAVGALGSPMSCSSWKDLISHRTVTSTNPEFWASIYHNKFWMFFLWVGILKTAQAHGRGLSSENWVCPLKLEPLFFHLWVKI